MRKLWLASKAMGNRICAEFDAKARYQKLVHDGCRCRWCSYSNTLVNFWIYRVWNPFLEAGYIAQPPIYGVKVGSEIKEYIQPGADQGNTPARSFSNATKEGRSKPTIQRVKGLEKMTTNSWETTMNPWTSPHGSVSVDDAAEADKIDMLAGWSRWTNVESSSKKTLFTVPLTAKNWECSFENMI